MNSDSTVNFLCIGAPKCGTTWLHEILNSHPEICVPASIKEVHYFDRYYTRGEEWYHSLFENHIAGQKKGETTPHYLYLDDCERIYNYNKKIKLILILRDPTDRCVSHYKYRQRLDNYQGSFSDFLNDYPTAIEWSLYGIHLKRYLEVFKPEQILLLDFHAATKELQGLKRTLSAFLDIDPELFPSTSGKQRVNEHITLKYPLLYRFSVRFSRLMVDLRLYKLRQFLKFFLVNFLKKQSTINNNNFPVPTRFEMQELEFSFREDQSLLNSLRKYLQ